MKDVESTYVSDYLTTDWNMGVAPVAIAATRRAWVSSLLLVARTYNAKTYTCPNMRNYCARAR